jgi:tripartite ATP-independent transporter DctM subunit
MVVYAGIANVATGALFVTGIVPGILLGLGMMVVVKYYSKKKNFPKCEKVPFKEVLKLTFESLPALLTPIILIGGIVTGVFTPTESAAFACIYALVVGMFFYKTIKVKALPRIIMETLKLSSLSLFALATANALGELLSYYQLNVYVQEFFTSISGGKIVFLLVIIAFFMFIGTFMDSVPAMILFVPIILPSAVTLGISPIILGLIIIVTLALGLVTPPYGLCLLIASSISGITIEDAFKGTLPYFLSSVAILILMALFPDFLLGFTTALFPALFS